ncbi:type VI secretion system membrane subunit TssM [Rhodoferax lacus]|uniref:Type VI secretion system membrane subunit TssM n=1 Tax=Rhodoferax lacus TaxID=2184758 RepID=A0A3E1RA48_9BURK|nr:type VI secretion system membrane subunit TssM [Rhodoferax lacus]RFO96239.1 type VI secretion system membrane subunit TssM [Rhodoferax lacus]
MQGFFASPVVRAILAFLALILVALAVWFIGPLLAFGELHPLASVGIRVTTICLMLVFVVFALMGWTLSVIGVTCLCLLVWHAGPLLAFANFRPLEPVWARAVTISVIAFIYLVWAVYTLWNLIRSDEAFAKRLFGQDKDAPKALAKDEVRAIADIARKSVAQLRQMHSTMAGGTGSVWAALRRLVEGKRYLYELPWYMIIGTPGAGKTSALLNSGLKFPMAEQMGTASAQMTLSQNAGTLNCAWWFTNEAVLIDTAGRYTNPQDGRGFKRLNPPKDGAGPAEPVDASVQEQTNAAEWKGFLGVLRKARARAPINGALLAVDTAKLLGDDDAQAMAHAAQLRARLGELRQELGIRFPVYVVLTKTDLLRGFAEYFASLTTEARAQVWGFTLPWVEQGRGTPKALAPQIERELTALQRRVSDGVATRLQEEFELDRRQALYVLPHELAALAPRLTALLDAVFSDSRFDTTQLTHTLRGVYFTSAMQFEDRKVTADHRALVPRLKLALAGLAARLGGNEPAPVFAMVNTQGRASSTRSFFMSDALTRVVFPEAHLVKPNLKWEARFRLLRLVGHLLVLVAFLWLAGALLLSHTNNQSYLDDVGSKTETLTDKMRALVSHQNTDRMIEVLGLAQALPMHSGLDLGDPSGAYLYGLYAAEPVADAAHSAYGDLQDRLILPVLTQRMEAVMRSAVQAGDSKAAYDTLHVYLLLHDKEHYSASPSAAQEVRTWVLTDWQEGAVKESAAREAATRPVAPIVAPRDVLAAQPKSEKLLPLKAADSSPGLAASFGNSTAMVSHLEDMFSGKRLVQSATARDEALVRQVRGFLDMSSSSQRLYQRTKAALLPDAPQDFTLVRALGPQAGTLFSRASGKTLEKGVSGFFTYDGYHALFAKRLPELVAVAQADDAWVMGRTEGVPGQKKLLEFGASASPETAALTEEIRRQYLEDYADLWTDYLADLRIIRTEGGGSLAFELNVLRQLAAPDSPLARLGRLVARETTLSRPLQTTAEADKSLFDKATEQLDKKTAQVSKDLGLRPEQRTERMLVDQRFSALREVVTGQTEGAAIPGGKPALDGITNLLNEYYTALVVADTAISSGALPPAGVEAATKIRIEAGKLPAPFREVLLGVSANGSDKVAQGAASILQVQARAQMDRLVGMLALTVGEPCKRNIAGRYPFAQSTQEVEVDDFNAMFAAGGAADEYFTKFLAPLVDTSARPWKYKNAASALALVGTESLANGQAPAAVANGPTLTGELLKLLAAGGPNPDFFAQVQQIREAYFKEPGAKRMAWKLDVSVQSLDPTVTELLLDMDGQSQRYAHGPVQALQVQWPGTRGGTMAEISAQPRIKADTSVISVRGPWALLHLMERGRIVTGASSGRVAVEFLFDNRRAVLEVGSSGVNPLSSPLLKSFNCPLRAI